MDDAMNCPKCNSEHTYQDRGLWVCPECAHEWSAEGGGAARKPRLRGRARCAWLSASAADGSDRRRGILLPVFTLTNIVYR